MKKRNLTFAILVLAVVLTAVGVSGTYARYTTTEDGTATATVAKWSVLLNGDEMSDEEEFELELNEEVANTFVVAGVIAPDKTVYGDLVIDLEGTQVATDIEVTVDKASITGIEGDPSRFTVTVVPVVGTTEGTALSLDTSGKATIGYLETGWDGTAAYGENKGVTVRVKLTWTNTDLTADNTADTNMGIDAGDITVPLTVTAKQHVAADSN